MTFGSISGIKNLPYAPEEIAFKLSEELELNPNSVTTYGSYSENKTVKKEANSARKKIRLQLSGIESLWNDYVKQKPSGENNKIIEYISFKTGLAESTVAILAGVSANLSIKKIANREIDKIMNKRYQLDKLWNSIGYDNPTYSIQETFNEVCNSLNLTPTTIVRYLRGSELESVKKHYSQLYYTTMDNLHNITEKWSKLLKESPNLTPLERAELIGENEQLNSYSGQG